MATYPGALPTIPDDGTWTHTQAGDEVEAIAAELGVNPSGSQATVASRFTTVENRVTTLEGATTTAGVEIGSFQLTTDFSILAAPTTWTDIGASVALGAQTRAYNVQFRCLFIAATSASFTPTKLATPSIRIVDSAVTVVLTMGVSNIIMHAVSTNFLMEAFFVGRVPAGRAATTWKVQARNLTGTIDPQVTALAVYAGSALGAPAAGLTKTPALLQAITV